MISNTVEYLYDGLSRLTKGTNDVSVVERRYDSLSRLIEEVQDGKSVQYGYDRVGNPTSIRYPNQRLVEREFDLLNRISRVKQGNDIVSTMEFLGRSYRLASKGYQNGDLVKYLYDQGRRLTSSETKNKNQAILQSFGWGYDSLDLKSFEKRIHDGGKGDSFSYDALKRLTNVTFDSPTPETPGATGVKSRSITLDKLDNILKITDNESGMLTEIVGELEGKGKVLNQYSRFNGLPLEHDKNGNLSAKGSRLFTYDYKNRLIRSSKGDDAVTFTYDIFGRQTSRTDVSGTCHYFYAGDQKIEERNSAGQVTKHYFWGNGIDELLRLDIYNGNVAKPYYVHSDAIGSTTTVTDENGNVVERVRYDAYGVPSFTDALGQSLKKSTIGNTTLFQGREYDYDLALYNYRARYFDPSQGRFLQTDPLGYQDSMNLYQGMGMNPVNFVDPWGEETYRIFFGFRQSERGKDSRKQIVNFPNFNNLKSLIGPDDTFEFISIGDSKYSVKEISDSLLATDTQTYFIGHGGENPETHRFNQFVLDPRKETYVHYPYERVTSRNSIVGLFTCGSNQYANTLIDGTPQIISVDGGISNTSSTNVLAESAYNYLVYRIRFENPKTDDDRQIDEATIIERANQPLIKSTLEKKDQNGNAYIIDDGDRIEIQTTQYNRISTILILKRLLGK